MNTCKEKTMWISKEAYFFLDAESRRQRGCRQLTPEAQERFWNHIAYFRKNGNEVNVTDSSFGGGDGTYYGRWWRWSIDTLKGMLDEAGYTYRDGDDQEYIPVDLSGTMLA